MKTWIVDRAASAHEALRPVCDTCAHQSACDECPVMRCMEYLLFDIRSRVPPELLNAPLEPDQERAIMIVERELRLVKGGRKRVVRGHDPGDHPRGA